MPILFAISVVSNPKINDPSKLLWLSRPGPMVIKKNLCSTQLSMKFILLINVKCQHLQGFKDLLAG